MKQLLIPIIILTIVSNVCCASLSSKDSDIPKESETIKSDEPGADQSTTEITSTEPAQTVQTDEYDEYLPSYWKEYIKNKAKTISQSDPFTGGDNAHFIFITDAHLRGSDGEMHNSCYSPYLMKYLHDKCNINLAFFGGDAITSGYRSQEDAISDLKFFKSTFAPVWDWTHCIFGNHDYGAIGSNIDKLDKQEMYDILISDKESQYESVNPDYGSYVLDDADHGIRYICLNLNEGNNLTQQNDFFCDAMLNAPADWSIIFITHFSLEPGSDSTVQIAKKLTNKNSIIPAIDAFNGREEYGSFDFSNARAQVACVIGGHCHFDGMVKTESGVPVISVACDKFHKYENERIVGATTEQAFDVVTIDTSSETITLNRIGYGSDRSYSYGSQSQ